MDSRTRSWQVLSGTTVLGALFLASCGSSDPVETARIESGEDLAGTTAVTSTTVADDDLPITEIGFSDLADDPDISQVLGFAEGGDNPCYEEVPTPVSNDLTLVDNRFRDSLVLQIGWEYAFCFGGGFPADDVRLFEPDGTEVIAGEQGPLPLIPGAPVGTYRVTATANGQPVEAGVEVADAVDERIFVDPNSTGPDAHLFVVGFIGREQIPIGVYETGGGEYFFHDLVGTFDVELAPNGTAGIIIEGDGAATGRCVRIVADPVQAIAEDSYELDGHSTLDFANQLVTVNCFE